MPELRPRLALFCAIGMTAVGPAIAAPANAQSGCRGSLPCRATAFKLTDALERPRLDGRLDEPAWARAVPATGFVQFAPDPVAAHHRAHRGSHPVR